MRKVLAIVAVVVCATSAAISSCSAKEIQVEMSGFVAHVQPILHASNNGGRVYYQGICQGSGMSEELHLPVIYLREVPPGKTGIEAVQLMLPPEAVVEQRPGLISMRLASVPAELLNTTIRNLTFTESERFDSTLAVIAVMENSDVKSAMRRMGFNVPVQDVSIMPTTPRSELPHLPASLSSVTVDQALDLVARTFGNIVFFGVCEKSHLILVNSAGGYDWEP
jgi:hypothetical protein